MDNMTLKQQVQTAPAFMVWFLNWSQTGDYVKAERKDDGELILRAYDCTDYLCAEFSTTKGLTTYK